MRKIILCGILLCLSGCAQAYYTDGNTTAYYNRIWDNSFEGVSIVSSPGGVNASIDKQSASGLSSEEVSQILSIIGAL